MRRTWSPISNFTCLATAQHAVLRRTGWDLNRQGLRGAPPVRVIVGEHRHASIDRGARFCGIGSAALTAAEWAGRAALRCSMSSWATTADDIDRTVAAIGRLATAG
ncbi:hypothetical protein ACQ143_01665 [Microbacterium sp. MC2]